MIRAGRHDGRARALADTKKVRIVADADLLFHRETTPEKEGESEVFDLRNEHRSEVLATTKRHRNLPISSLNLKLLT